MAPCTIRWCGYNSQTSSFRKDGITFHRYPQDPDIKNKWIIATKRENWFPTTHSVICSRHFTEDCFMPMKNRRRLLSSAVPTMYLPLLSNAVDSDVPIPSTSRPEVMVKIKDLPIASTSTGSTFTKTNSPVSPLGTSKQVPNENSLKSPSFISTPKKKKHFPGSPSDYATPVKKRLCRRIIELSDKILQKNKSIKNLKEKTRYMRKRLVSLKNILSELENQKLINSCNADLLGKIGVTNRELVKRQVMKSNKKGITIRKKYSPELRTFALTLNFYSAKAYKYVRKTFQTCLPSIKTLSKWYQTVDGRPGFTKEAFTALKNKAAQCEGELIATLVFDEIKIKSKVEYVPSTQRTFGYVDFGGEIQTDCSSECTEALVLLVVGLNKRFKVPIGYFLTNGTNAEQKHNLVIQAISLCHDNNVTVKAVTFDGCPANIAMVKLLGCSLLEQNMKTFFPHPITNNHVFIFLDPVHMLKLVRNAFEYYREFKNSDGGSIKWDYINLLHQIQEREQFHLANKLRLSHIEFKQNVMKVKLAAQLFSRSVATALNFCKSELKLQEFQNVDATVEMLLIINDLFDILDSRVHGYGFKRALNKDNSSNVLKKLEACKKYIVTLTVKLNDTRTVKLINSPRYTGFIGFCIAIQSVIGMFHDIIDKNNFCIKYIPFNKISQDHIELFFANIRSHGGSNDNPTPRLFEAIYKKLLIHTELMDVSTGNCVPLEHISILNCSSALGRINLTTTLDDKQDVGIDETESHDDLNRALERITLSLFAERAVEYIAGFVSSSLVKRIKCKTCIGALVSLNQNQNSLIAYRDKGGLIYPSPTVVKICRRSEVTIKAYLEKIPKNQKRKTDVLVNKTLSSFIGEELFSNISNHQFQSEVTNHVVDLSMCVMHKYISTRLAFLTKSAQHKHTVRRIYTKLIHFKND